MSDLNLEANAAKIQLLPHKPSTTPSRDPLSSDTALIVDFAPMIDPENGGAEIISYHLQYDDSSGGSIWTDLIGLASDSLALTHTVSTSIQVGSIYRYRYRAKNAFGFGPFSEPLYLYAARVPVQIAQVTITNEDTVVRISWAAPSYNGGSPILGYRIKIQEQDGGKSEQMTYCNGLEPTIKANRYCIVPMTVLTSDPYHLVQGHHNIFATVEALNVVGYS